MNNISLKVLLLAGLILLFSDPAKAYRPTRTYSAKVQAGLSSSSTGGGKVYVDTEATAPKTVSDSEWRPNSSEQGSEGGNSSNSENVYVPVYLYAKANTGYQFDGWADSDTGTPGNKDQYPYIRQYQVGNNDPRHHPYRTKEYSIYAFFSPIEYTITYDAAGGALSDASTQTYTIRSTDLLRVPSRAGHEFLGWEVVATEGNWPAVGETTSSSLNQNYGNVTLKAKWKAILADITIEVSGLENGESAIFTVTNNDTGTLLYTIPVTGTSSETASVKIKALETGMNYMVRPVTDWTKTSYGIQGISPNGGTIKGLGAGGVTFSFTAEVKADARKHDEKSNVNWSL